MGLFRKKSKLKKEYDERLATQLKKQQELWNSSKQLEEVLFEKHPTWQAQKKLQKAKYFYLFKEARIRNIKGNYLD